MEAVVAVEAVEAAEAVEADTLLWEGEQEVVVVDEEQDVALEAEELEVVTLEAAAELQQPAKRPRRAAEAKANEAAGTVRGARGIAAISAANAATNTAAAADAAEQTWVQCEDCEKWRRVRGGQPASRRWRCQDNRDDARHASCAVPQAIVSIAMVGMAVVVIAIVISPALSSRISPYLRVSRCRSCPTSRSTSCWG